MDVLIVGGGTSGAAAAIGAARQGSSTLVIEEQANLGGIGTVGLIGAAYHGLDRGFASQVPFPHGDFNLEDKMEWYRKTLQEAGGQIWTGVLTFGALKKDHRVTGVAVASPWGFGLVRAEVVIDATGNGDVAVAAGAEYEYGDGGRDVALQGTGLSLSPLGAHCTNSDFLFVDDSDRVDATRAAVGVRQAAGDEKAYDTTPMIMSRERRRIVGDHTLRYLDQILGRTYPDSVVISKSDYDSHGYPSHPYFALLPHTEETRILNHPAPGGMAYTPYRCLLPKGLEGILILGLATSMERDASAIMRMQRD
ncbi:MAG: FAD-dependent oxidoreductase, partial [Planctomycetota bacterium]